MKNLRWMFASMALLGLLSCSNSAASDPSTGSTNDSTATTHEMNSSASEQNMSSTSNPGFSSLVSKYKTITLPHDFGLGKAIAYEDWKTRKIDQEGVGILTGNGGLTLEEGEEPFAGYTFKVSESITALVTYVMGDFKEQYVLHTHDASGKMIAQLPIWMVSEEVSYGYASDISVNKKVNRGKMIPVEGGGQDVEMEEIFQIAEDGQITKVR